ncbi:transporter [Noviherbaspirillum sp. UKPF54]|uniref:transporter n=1 Tax=Noviherbaspirillum sp. UKPF54 TaxID=2601898 RepID=UPI0011B1AB25|nr:transporter [Noviherbaspirillum sp. UKPF54]QDZ26805.1 transporter [Noviherbaspirillum sp. UKPF54]
MKRLSFAAIALLSPLFSQVALADGGFSFKTGYDYSSGTYGTSNRTEITSIPFIAGYETGNWAFKATLPYVRITGSDNVIAGVGAVRRSTTAVRTESGLGDLMAAATYSLFADPKTQSGVDVTGKIKFGTADSDKGLGTGQNDYWLTVDPYKKFGNMTYFGGLGVGFLGSSSTLKLNNVVSANAGLSYKLDAQASAGAIFDYRSKASDAGFDQRELTAFYSRKLGEAYKLQAYATKGFSDGSPDWGAGLNVGYHF